MTATESHYSLRWNNHQNEILSEFDTLLQAETLVDVTLVCAKTSVRAHKVVLGACSPFFQRIFSENPCKHPVIVLKDFNDWEVRAIIDFMYKGEISVGEGQLQSLINTAESLQIRGLGTSTNVNRKTERSSPSLQHPGQHNCDDNEIKLPHRRQLSISESVIPKQDRNFIPREEQTKMRKRSRGLHAAQDLTTLQKPHSSPEETANNICVKKPKKEKEELEQSEIHKATEHPKPDLSIPNKSFTTSLLLSKQPLLKEGHLPISTNSNVSAFGMGQSQNNLSSLDAPIEVFSLRMDDCRDPLLRENKRNRPKGGPPRSWTDAELTEALQHVWNKKMTRVQASQTFGIPYNSLKKYVRGTYGKSLKLDQRQRKQRKQFLEEHT